VTKNVREGFAERLRIALDEAGHGETHLKELGALFGVTAQAVRKWREGEAIPTSEHAPHVAERLGVRRAWLLDGELPMRPRMLSMAEKHSGYQAEELSISKDEFKLLSDYRGLPHGLRTALEQFVEVLKRELKRK
jgi:transcriptional regulator with XRE-family HTH domain